jgi:hypothetical protein
MTTFLELTPRPETKATSTKLTLHNTSVAHGEKAFAVPIKFLELTPPLDAFKPLYSTHGLSTANSDAKGAAHGFMELTPPALRKVFAEVKDGIVAVAGKEELVDLSKSAADLVRSRIGVPEMERLGDEKYLNGKAVLQKRVDSAKGLRKWPC